MSDNDIIVLEEAKEIAFTLDKAYRSAVLDADLDRMVELKPKVDEAYDNYSSARLKLLEEGVIATADDVAEIRRIREEIDKAAETQTLIMGAIKFVTFIAKFVV